MVAALVLGTNDFGRESSSLSWGTQFDFQQKFYYKLYSIKNYDS